MAIGDIYTDKQIDEELDKLLPVINKGKQQPITKELARSILMAENMGNTGGVTFANRRSPKNAVGVAQVIPPTLEGLKKTGYLPADFTSDLENAPLGEQIFAGLAAMRDFVDRHKTTDPYKIAALYNAGDRGAKKYLESGKIADLPAETQLYLPKIDRAYEAMNTPVPVSPSQVRGSALFSSTPLDAATRAYRSVEEMFPQVMDALFQGQRDIAGHQQMQQAALLASGEAAAEAARAQAEDTIAQQQVHQAIMEAFGLDVRDPDSAINQELQIAANTRKQREDLGKRIAELQGKTLFSDPLGWIMAQPELAAMIPEYNRMVDVENTAEGRVTKLQNAANMAKNLTAARSADLIRAKAQADATQFVKNAEAQAAQISAQNAAGQARMFLDAFTMQRNMFSDILSLEGREAAIEDRRLQMSLRKEAQALKEEEKQRESAFLVALNAMRKTISGNVPEYTREDLKNMPAQVRAIWHEAILRGNYGNDYQKAIPFIRTFGDIANAANTGNKMMMSNVMNIAREAEQLAPKLMNEYNLKNPMAKISREQATELAYSQLYMSHVAYAQKGADKGDLSGTNPYALDFEAAAIAAKSQGAKGNIVSDVLIRAKEQTPYESLNLSLTPRGLVARVKAEVVAGRIDPAKAAQQLSAFFKEMSETQYVDGGLKYLGLPKFTDFIVRPGGHGKQTVDLYNPTAVENYLTYEASRRNISGLVSAFGDPFWR